MSFQKLGFLLLASLSLATAACDGSDDDGGSSVGGSPETATFDNETAKRWFDQLNAAIDGENLNPPEASRRIGYTGVAFYEAVVGGMPEHRSLGRQLNGLGELPEPPAGVLHWPAVANATTAAVLNHLFASAAMPNTLPDIAALEAALVDEFDDTVDQATLDRSNQYGQDIAAEINAWSDEDGYSMWNDCAFTPPVGEGLWVPTGAVTTPLEPCWGNLRPFVLLFGAECAPLAHPPFSMDTGSAFCNEALEVYDTVNNITPEQQEIAIFWADGGGTLTPPGHWVSITGQILEQEGLALDVAAEAYCKVGLAVADAFISCWEIKYYYNLLRPVTYIQDPVGPVNDPAWATLFPTPPFPEYTSGHSTQSGAAAEVLTDLLGEIPFTDHTHDLANPPITARSFTSFEEAAQEAAISRLYGGIHYRAAIERGVEQGRCIGRLILRNIEFRE